MEAVSLTWTKSQMFSMSLQAHLNQVQQIF